MLLHLDSFELHADAATRALTYGVIADYDLAYVDSEFAGRALKALDTARFAAMTPEAAPTGACFCGFRFRCNGGVNNAKIFGISSGASENNVSLHARYYTHPDGTFWKMTLWNGSTYLGESDWLAFDIHHYIEAKFDPAEGVEIRVNQAVSVAILGTWGVSWDRLYLNIWTDETDEYQELNDLYLLDELGTINNGFLASSPTGMVVRGTAPDADTDLNEWTGAAVNQHHAKVEDVANFDGDTSYLEADTLNQTELYETIGFANLLYSVRGLMPVADVRRVVGTDRLSFAGNNINYSKQLFGIDEGSFWTTPVLTTPDSYGRLRYVLEYDPTLDRALPFYLLDPVVSSLMQFGFSLTDSSILPTGGQDWIAGPIP